MASSSAIKEEEVAQFRIDFFKDTIYNGQLAATVKDPLDALNAIFVDIDCAPPQEEVRF